MRRNLIARLLLNKRKRKLYTLPAYFRCKNRYPRQMRSLRLFTSTTSQTHGRVVSTLQWITSQTGRWETPTGVQRKRERAKRGSGWRVNRQIREMRSDFAFFLSSIFFIYIAFTEPSLSLRNTTRKVRPCQIGDTLFGDCTRTLLSPSGVSEET